MAPWSSWKPAGPSPIKSVICASLIVLGATSVVCAAEPRRGPWGEPGSTLEMASRMDAESMSRLQAVGASVEETPDEKSFVVWHAPEGFDPKTGITLVTLHGHQSWAGKSVMVWADEVRARGWAHLAVQWWYGRSAETHGYARPADVYPWIVDALRRHGVEPGRVIFQGFSMGSAISYAVTFLDRQAPAPYFAVTIANSGSMAEDYLPNRPFLSGEAGAQPFAHTHWILYCSEHDQEQRQACERMAWGAEQLERLGGAVDLFIRDPQGPHGGFMSPANLDRSLDQAVSVIR